MEDHTIINGDGDFEEIPYQESGLICEECGYTDSLKCYLWNDEIADDEVAYIYCGKHAAENGFCCCCGTFCAGMTSFDFNHPGLLTAITAMKRLRDHYDEDDEYYDPNDY